MSEQTDGMQVVRSQLCQTVERLQAEARRMSGPAIARRMSEIERTAREHGLMPLARVARSGAHAAFGPGHRAAIECHLQHMEHAIGCARLDDDATSAIMASIAIRLR